MRLSVKKLFHFYALAILQVLSRSNIISEQVQFQSIPPYINPIVIDILEFHIN